MRELLHPQQKQIDYDCTTSRAPISRASGMVILLRTVEASNYTARLSLDGITTGIAICTVGSGTRTEQPRHSKNELAIVPWLSKTSSVKRIPSTPNVHFDWVYQMKAKSRKMPDENL
jgi:hypothetical protein